MSDTFHFSQYSLFTKGGERKYLNKTERKNFYNCTKDLPLAKRLFSQMIYYTGARIMEVAELRVPQIDFTDRTVILRTLKQRRTDVYRQIPLPDPFLQECNSFLSKQAERKDERVWPFSCRTGARAIKEAMSNAKVFGQRANARGLRHSFAVHGVSKLPISQLQRWLGHASLNSTSIYLQISGDEERDLAEKLWDEEY